MTPAIEHLKRHKIPFKLHEYAHDPASGAFGLEAADKMGVDANRVFKTLMVAYGGRELAVGIVPVSAMLNMKAMAKALGAKKVAMADPAVVERVSGYVLGGVSPFGQKKQLPTVLDQSSATFDTIFVSGGRRGLEIEVAPDELTNVLKARMALIT